MIIDITKLNTESRGVIHVGAHQEIGKFIGNSKIQVIFENKNPYVVYEGNRIKINNLHIHSKNTGLYL